VYLGSSEKTKREHLKVGAVHIITTLDKQKLLTGLLWEQRHASGAIGNWL
jgi:hypothetical protein